MGCQELEILSFCCSEFAKKQKAKTGRETALRKRYIWNSWMEARRIAGRHGPDYSGKTFASTAGGYTTFSGGLSPGFLNRIRTSQTEKKIFNEQEESDTLKTLGQTQLEFSSEDESKHAEAKMSIKKPNEPIGVTKTMCSGCQRIYRNLARRQNAPQVVDDGGTEPRVFLANRR